MSDGKFDAARYVVNLRGKDYLEVKWRLVWLRTEHPDALIETEMLKFDPPLAIFKATITLTNGAKATGHGQEEAADFGDYLEKAETKALGRALAALGYGTQFTEDFEFKDESGQRVVDAPVERPQQAMRAATPAPANGATKETVHTHMPSWATATGEQIGTAPVWEVQGWRCTMHERDGVLTFATVDPCPEHDGKRFVTTPKSDGSARPLGHRLNEHDACWASRFA